VVVTSVSLRDFRNYERAELELGDGLNVVHGPNGAGKTNLLEALYFSLTGRSCRTSNERELVRSGQQVTRVVAELAGDHETHTLEVGFAPSQKEKLVKVDGAPLERRGAPPPRPLVCVFLPARLPPVKGPPGSRCRRRGAPTSTRSSRRSGRPGPRRARPTRARWLSATHSWPASAPAPPGRTCSTRGTPSWPVTARSSWPTVHARSARSRPRSQSGPPSSA